MFRCLLICILASSCGMKVKTDIPKKFEVEFGPAFAKGAQFCDDRYGKGTTEAEACFLDYRKFTELRVSADPATLVEYCKSKYTVQQEIDQCEDDLHDLINGGNTP